MKKVFLSAIIALELMCSCEKSADIDSINVIK